MKLSTKKLPMTARLFIKVNGVELFNGLVVEYNKPDIQYTYDVIIRVRQYGMTPIEYDGSLQAYADMVKDGVFEPIGYKDLIIPEALPELPFDKEAKAIMDEAILKQEAKMPVTIGHSDA